MAQDRLTTRTISVPAEDCKILDWLDAKVKNGEGNFSEVLRKYLRKCMEAESGENISRT